MNKELLCFIPILKAFLLNYYFFPPFSNLNETPLHWLLARQRMNFRLRNYDSGPMGLIGIDSGVL